MKTEILNFKIIEPNNFISFLKKFKLIDKSVVLEVEYDNIFGKIKTYDRSVLKYVKINFNDIFEGELLEKRLKIGILELTKIIDIFKYFDTKQPLNLTINAEPYNNEFIASKLNFYNNYINIFINCADIDLLSYVKDEIQQNVHSTENFEVKCNIPKEKFKKLNSLITIDNNPDELLIFTVNNDNIEILGNSFKYYLIKDENINNFSSSKKYVIYKKQFSYVDIEDSEIYFHDNRIIIKSIETNTTIAIGLVEI